MFILWLHDLKKIISNYYFSTRNELLQESLSRLV